MGTLNLVRWRQNYSNIGLSDLSTLVNNSNNDNKKLKMG